MLNNTHRSSAMFVDKIATCTIILDKSEQIYVYIYIYRIIQVIVKNYLLQKTHYELSSYYQLYSTSIEKNLWATT